MAKVRCAGDFCMAIVGAGFISLTFFCCLVSAGRTADERRITPPRANADSQPPSRGDDDSAEPSADEESDADDDLSEMLVPSDVLAKLKTVDRLKYLQELRGLLVEGIADRGDGSAAARRHFEALRRITAGDPRGPYAYGLALLAQKKAKEALEQFRAAVQTSVPFLPALQGVARAHVLAGDLSTARPRLLELANQIEVTSDSSASDQARERSAEWLGRMMGFLTGPGKPAGAKEDFERLETEIEGLLTADRKAAYESGRKAVVARYEEFQALARRPPDELRNEVNRRKDEIAGSIKAAAEEVRRLDEEVKAVKMPLDKEISAAQREIRVSGPKVKRLTRDIEETTALVADLSVPRKYPTSSTSTSTRMGRTRTTTTYSTRSETTSERQAREANLAAAKEKLTQLQSSLEYSSGRYDEALRQRDELKSEMKRATAELVVELTAAKRKRLDVASRAKVAEQALVTPEKLQSRLTALETYLPFDPAAERTRLLATLKPRPKAG
jgi:hypothetical protein